MRSYCDSCTDEKEIKEYISAEGEPYYWCDGCKEEEERIVSLPFCAKCEERVEEEFMDGSICQSCADGIEIGYWRNQ